MADQYDSPDSDPHDARDEGVTYEHEAIDSGCPSEDDEPQPVHPDQLICTDLELEEGGFTVGYLVDMPEIDSEFVSAAVAHGEDISVLLDACADGRDLASCSGRTSRALCAVAEWWGTEEVPALLGLLSDLGATPGRRPRSSVRLGIWAQSHRSEVPTEPLEHL